MKTSFAMAIGALVITSLFGCEREDRRFRESPPSTLDAGNVTMSALQPGASIQNTTLTGPYEYNAYAVNEGKMLFNNFNCSGCHANGGGGMGPPLMDDEWIYGAEPENIFSTIVEGRPNGMPSFRGRLSNDQIWRLVSYVRAMSGQLSKDVGPSRDDHMGAKKSEQRVDREKPVVSYIPKSSER
jgi:cytochrome c oxidase cbb3-type subunit III